MLCGVFMKIKKIFVITTSIIFIISILLLLLVVIIYFNTKNNIDFSIDESLFISNSSGNYTRLYYNLSDNHEEYSPGEYSSILPSSDRKTWFSYDTMGENI